MITPQYVQVMARYNGWQNQSLYGAADTLDAAARQLDRGAFFKSIQATLTHILWGDSLWMSRFDNWDKSKLGIADIPDYFPDWQALKAERLAADKRFVDWGTRVTQADLAGDLSWYSGALKQDLTRPRAVCVMQIFNHQTHHRGQVHAMLTAAGAKPADTDLPFIPDDFQV